MFQPKRSIESSRSGLDIRTDLLKVECLSRNDAVPLALDLSVDYYVGHVDALGVELPGQRLAQCPERKFAYSCWTQRKRYKPQGGLWA
jgi:hypothetical protein